MKSISGLGASLKLIFSCSAFFCLPGLVSAQLVVTIASTNVTCYGAANGQATANPIGGAPPYTYAWSTNGSTQTIQNLLPGTYSVTVHDANQVSATAMTNISEPTQMGVELYGQSQLCEVAPDGSAGVVAFLGTPDYTYLWSNAATTAQIGNLVAGTYTVTVTDANGCTVSGFYTLNYWAEGIYLLPEITHADCAYENGAAQIVPYSGTPPYAFQWSTGETTQAIEDLAAGTYSVTVTDVNGCEGSDEITIVSNAPLSIFITIPTPLCLASIATFTQDPPPPIYPQILWTLSDTLDQIISGQGTDTIEVQWASAGAKTVHYQFGANDISCRSITYSFNVVVCADAVEPWLAATRVSPNPFSDFVQVEFPAGMPAEAEAVLTDVSGKIVLELILSDAAERLLTSNLPAGIYFLKIKSSEGQRVWKLVKQ